MSEAGMAAQGESEEEPAVPKGDAAAETVAVTAPMEKRRPGSGAGGAEADTRGMPANPLDLVKVKTLKQSKKE